MPLADTWAKVSSILTQQAARDQARRERESSQSIQDLYSSGQPVDQGSIQKLLASGADPASVASIAKIMRGQTVDTARVENLHSQIKVRESPMVAGAIKKAFDTWNSKPPEEQTQSEWEKWKATGRSHLASNGLDPELIPADADPAFIDMQIGAGYDPGAQDLTTDRRSENVARQGRFETSQADINARFGMAQTGMDRRAALSRSAADARERDKGTPTPKPTQFDRDMAQLTPEQAKKALLVKYNLEKGPGAEPKPEKPMTPANAGKIEMLQQAERDIEDARALIFDESGELNRVDLGLARLPGGGLGEKARLIASKIENAVSAKYRLETGAAGNEEEVRSIARRFQPSPLDTKGSAEDKISRLQQFMSETLSLSGAPAQQFNRAPAPLQPARVAPGVGTPSRSAQGSPAAPASAGMDPERAELERLRALKAAAMAGR